MQGKGADEEAWQRVIATSVDEYSDTGNEEGRLMLWDNTNIFRFKAVALRKVMTMMVIDINKITLDPML